MDPLSILGITASTVQFIDFGSRLLKALVNETMQGSGFTGSDALSERYERLKKDATQLADIGQAIETKMESVARSRGDRLLTPTEMAILEESRRCTAAGLEIMASFGKDEKRHPRSILENIGTAFKLVWNERSVGEMMLRLADARSSLMLAIISNLWERPAVTTGDVGAEPATRVLQHQALVDELRYENEPEETDDQRFIHSMFTYHETAARAGGQRPTAAEKLNADDAEHVDALLSSLHFIARESRVQAIPEAYRSTFDWALQEPRLSDQPDEKPLWDSFPEWLEGDSENVYWITGKPGSGKSTLMKHIVAQPKTLSFLQRWSGDRKVLMATFYSWDAGNDLQKSQTGFLRTLLYQIVEQAPDTMPRLFPGRWATQKIFGRVALEHLPPWTWEELFQSFISLTTLLRQRKERSLAIFVDGLDEFSGDHTRLIDLVKHFHSQEAVKVCVSSRPWNDFRDAFVSCPQLRIETLTENDLRIFVHGVSDATVAFREVGEAHPVEAQDLLSKVVEMASGVFLWVSLVMKVLLESLTDGDTLSDVEELLDSLPLDLSRLYSRLWERVKSRYRRDGCQLLLLFRAYTTAPILDFRNMRLDPPPGMEPEMLWLADGRRAERSESMLLSLRRKLHSRTMGLLEMAESDNQVAYLHRTTKEWLDTCWVEIESTAPSHFDPHLGILRAISHIASPTKPNPIRHKFKRQPITPWKLHCNVWGWILEAFYHAGRVIHDPDERVVQALDRIESSFRNVRFVTTTVLSVSSHWTQLSRGPSVPQFGFVGLAAEYGVMSYVRAKLEEEPDYISIEGEDEDLLSCVLLGPALRGLRSREYKPLSNTALRQRVPCIQKYVFNNLEFNHQERYELAKDMLNMLCTRRDGREAKIPLTVRNKLVPLAERVGKRNVSGWPDKELGMTPVKMSAGTRGAEMERERPYGVAVLKLLEGYGIGQKSGVRELFKEWLEGKR